MSEPQEIWMEPPSYVQLEDIVHVWTTRGYPDECSITRSLSVIRYISYNLDHSKAWLLRLDIRPEAMESTSWTQWVNIHQMYGPKVPPGTEGTLIKAQGPPKSHTERNTEEAIRNFTEWCLEVSPME